MPRLIVHQAQGPEEIKVGQESKWLCRCGLSQNQPFCDGRHQKTLDEKPDKIYQYDQQGNRGGELPAADWSEVKKI